MYATAALSDTDRAEVIRSQRSKVGDWQVGRLHALLVSTASSADRQEIEQALRFPNGVKA